MARYFIELCYKGTGFHGWQIQPNAPTIQSTLQEALSTILCKPINIVGCGRTDTGVHARYFVAHFDCSKVLENSYVITNKLNSILPKNIAVQTIRLMNNDVHSRFDANARTYKYYISRNKNPFLHEVSYYLPVPLSIDKMNLATKVLLEYEDFTSFSKLHTDVKNNHCTITEAYWEKEESMWVFTITANRFLRNMVRAIVGTILMVGKGKCEIQEFRAIIEAKDRCKAGSSAPPQGLFLYQVRYPYSF